jgi:hypothetical protein
MKKTVGTTAAAFVGMLAIGCNGPADLAGLLGGGIGNPNTNNDINVETGDVTQKNNQTVDQNQTVKVVQETSVEQNVMVAGGNILNDNEFAAIQRMREEIPPAEVIDIDETPACIPVEEITEDNLIRVCIALVPEFSFAEIDNVYFQFEGLEGTVEIPAAELIVETDPTSVCFNVEFIGELGETDDPIAALGGITGVGNALNCIYYVDTGVEITGGYETVIVEEGRDCDDGVLDEDFEEVFGDRELVL